MFSTGFFSIPVWPAQTFFKYYWAMITHHIASSEGKIDWVFLVATFVHRGTAYRAAVVQNNDKEKAEYGHNFHVLLQSEDRLHSFIMWKGDEEIWTCDNEDVSQEIIFLLGNEITEE